MRRVKFTIRLRGVAVEYFAGADVKHFDVVLGAGEGDVLCAESVDAVGGFGIARGAIHVGEGGTMDD